MPGRDASDDGLPESVPLLCGEDVCEPSRDVPGRERMSLRSWFVVAFGECRPAVREGVFSVVVARIVAATGYNGIHPPGASTSDMAAYWNRAMADLGYDVSPHLCVALVGAPFKPVSRSEPVVKPVDKPTKKPADHIITSDDYF